MLERKQGATDKGDSVPDGLFHGTTRREDEEEMCTLILSAPRWREQADHARSFEDTVSTAIGNGYAIDKHSREQVHEGCRVVVICRDCRPPKAVEGKLIRLVDTDVKTGSGMPGFD